MNEATLVHDPDSFFLADDFNVLRPEELANGAKILAYYPIASKEGIVLAHRRKQFVTWHAYWRIDGQTASWECQFGHYFRGAEGEGDAWDDFFKRVNG